MKNSMSRLFFGGVLVLVSTLALAQTGDAVRQEFISGYAVPTLDTSGDSEALRRYLLYPWLTAARAQLALADGKPETLAAARKLLADAGAVAAMRDLRRALLTQAAARSDGALFLAEWRDSVSTEALACQRLDARRSTGDTLTLAAEIAQRWLAEDNLPTACNASFAWLKTQAAYTPALIERRLRARLLDGDSSSARSVLAELPVERRARYQSWLRQLGTPSTEFAALTAGKPQLLDSEGVADAWARWARKSPKEAIALLDAFIAAQHLSAAQTEILQRNTALALAWDRDVRAVELFRKVSDAQMDDRSYEWRVRAALWAGNWNQALNWLVLMPPALAEQPRWRYWTARALAAVGQKGEAYRRYSSLARENDSYGLLAAWRADKSWTPIDEPKPISPEQRAALNANAAFARAREAWQAGLKPIASLEWRDAIETLPTAAKPALVRAAAELAWYDQALVTGTRLGDFRDLEALFPRPYASLVQQASADSGIPVQWLYGVMRKESAFKADARSPAGALGLLQMMPGTAAMTAKAAGQATPSNDALINPAINLPLGALHLREVLDKSDGRWQLALAAYNAGFNAVTRWLPPATMDADVWIENIPYNETRIYVQRVMFHVAVYQWLATSKPVRESNWLTPVEPVAVVTQ